MKPLPFSFLGGGESFPGMMMEWTTQNPGEEIFLEGQIGAGANYLYDVNWGDGSPDDIGLVTGGTAHTYADAGSYIVKISGQFAGLCMANSGVVNRDRLTKFIKWGTETEINGLTGMFFECQFMDYTASDKPIIDNGGSTLTATNGNKADSMFEGCTGISELRLSGWTFTIYIVDHYRMFFGCQNLEQVNLTSWDTSSSTTIQRMFQDVGSVVGDGCKFTLPDLVFTTTSANEVFFASKFNSATNLNGWKFNVAGVTIEDMFKDVLVGPGDFALDLTGWTGTNNITNMHGAFEDSDFDNIKLTNWDISNVTALDYAFKDCGNLQTIVGLGTLEAPACTTLNQTFRDCVMLTFAADDFGPNFSGAGSLTNLNYTFESVGAASAGGPFPDVSNWDVSNVTSLLSVFEDMNVNSDPNFAGWTLSGITNGTALTDFVKSTSGILNLDVSTFNFPNTVTSLHEFAANNSDIEVIDFGIGSTSDFSNITTLDTFANGSGKLVDVIWPATLDLSSLVDASAMMTSGALMSVTSYDLFLTVLDSTGPVGAYTLDAGYSTFTTTILSTGNDTAGAALSLTDAAADFITDGVAVGDIVYNGTTFDYAKVTVVVSLTELTLDVSIMNVGNIYHVMSSAVAKARYNLTVGGWTINDYTTV